MEKKRVAKNGLPVYSYTNRENHSFFISLFLRAGSMYEDEGTGGITHFYEHLAIRNVYRITNGSLYEELDRYGIEFNASTYGEMVQFYISGAAKHFRRGADIITKILSPLVLSREEIETERRRIKAEIREVDDRTSLSAFTAEKVYGGTSLSRSITGTAGGISKIGIRALRDFFLRVFTKDNLFFYVTGGVSDSDLDYLTSLAGDCSLGEGEAHENFAPQPPEFFKRRGDVYIKNADFTKLKFTFDIDMSAVSAPEGDLIYEILLGGYNSRFFIELSEKRGMFYDVSGSLERFRNIGTLSFSFEVRESDVYEAVRLTVGILNSLSESALPPDRCMKAAFVDNAEMLFDEPRELNFTFAYDNHILGIGYRDVSHRADTYRAVTPERLAEVARCIFRPSNLTFTMKGSVKRTDKEKLKSILKDLGKN